MIGIILQSRLYCSQIVLQCIRIHLQHFIPYIVVVDIVEVYFLYLLIQIVFKLFQLLGCIFVLKPCFFIEEIIGYIVARKYFIVAVYFLIYYLGCNFGLQSFVGFGYLIQLSIDAVAEAEYYIAFFPKIPISIFRRSSR